MIIGGGGGQEGAVREGAASAGPSVVSNDGIGFDCEFANFLKVRFVRMKSFWRCGIWDFLRWLRLMTTLEVPKAIVVMIIILQLYY